jgi:tetratricopeptide (TPR) repeat protein/tRNA A-37 threonylcarbamoyl transferase component Bud32
MTPEDARTTTGDGEVLPHQSGRRIPASLGRYRVLHLVGEGGMGAVYKVEQDRPHRVVALKVIKPGLATPELLRRFERESEVLARLHHPGIAQIYEVGTADAGYGLQPYFAMEFITGAPLRGYAERQRLNVSQRLELMARVCDAVEHAHRRGIIHRDLKPGNILVDEQGQPKILDFGVARVTDSDAQATRQTDLGQLIGTLAYMSPEQVLADPLELDTRSDVYALGVILYELLAGRLPYRIGASVLDAVRTIREEDPGRLSSISRAYRGDVETIVAKALEKDKSRRYSSAAALAADIRRYLAHEPIAARPASTIYQLQKFARRHRALVTATAVVFAVLLGGTVVSTREMIKARRAEQVAEAVNDFLQNDLLAQASAATQSVSSAKPDPDLKVRTALDRAAARLGGKFSRQPEVEAAIRYTIGRTYLDLGLYPEGRAQFSKALELQRQALGEENPATMKTLGRLGHTDLLQGNYAEAAQRLGQVLAIQRRILGAEHPDTLYSASDLAEVAFMEGKYAQAEALDKEVLEIQRRTLGPEHVSTLTTMNSLANYYAEQGKPAEAATLHRQTLELQRRVLGREHPETLVTMNNLAADYIGQRKYAEAETLFRETVEIQRRVLGADHPDTPMVMSGLARALGIQGKYAEAETLFSQAAEVQRRVLGPEHSYTLISLESLANIYYLRDNYADAEALFRKVLSTSERALGAEHPITLGCLTDMATMYLRQRKGAEAAAHAARALDVRRRLGSDQMDTMGSAADLALAYVMQEKFREAEPLAREVVAFYNKVDPDGWQRFGVESLLGATLAGQKKFSEAEPLLLEGYRGLVDRRDRIEVPARFYLDIAHEWVVQFYEAWGKPDKAAEWQVAEVPAQR